jgi:hypothetical protein
MRSIELEPEVAVGSFSTGTRPAAGPAMSAVPPKAEGIGIPRPSSSRDLAQSPQSVGSPAAAKGRALRAGNRQRATENPCDSEAALARLSRRCAVVLPVFFVSNTLRLFSDEF